MIKLIFGSVIFEVIVATWRSMGWNWELGTDLSTNINDILWLLTAHYFNNFNLYTCQVGRWKFSLIRSDKNSQLLRVFSFMLYLLSSTYIVVGKKGLCFSNLIENSLLSIGPSYQWQSVEIRQVKNKVERQCYYLPKNTFFSVKDPLPV